MTTIFDHLEKKAQQLSPEDEKDPLNITKEDLHHLFLFDIPIFAAQQHSKEPPTDEQLEELLCEGKKVTRDIERGLNGRDHSLIATCAVRELCYLANNNDGILWTKSPIDGRDNLDKQDYEQTFPRPYSPSEGSRAFAVVNMEPMRLAHELTCNKRSELFPTIVLEEITIRVLVNGSSLDNPDGSLQLIYTELQATTPLVPKRSFVFLRTCKQIDQSTWVVADVPIEPFGIVGYPYGCWIQGTAEGLSKAIWVEHLKVEGKYPTFRPRGFAFGAERWVACLERSCERKSYEMPTLPGGDEYDYHIRCMMLLGQRMVHAFCQIICPIIDDDHPWSFVTTGDNCTFSKIYATLRKSPYYDDPKEMVIVAATTVHLPEYPPEFVLEILGDERKRHEWDMSGRPSGLREVGCYTTGDHPRNRISVYEMDELSGHQILQETCVNRSGSLVVWSMQKRRNYDGGPPICLPLNTLSGFAISSSSSTTGGDSYVTLGVQLRAVGRKPLQELDPKAMPMDFINKYITETTRRIVLLLQKESAVQLKINSMETTDGRTGD